MQPHGRHRNRKENQMLAEELLGVGVPAIQSIGLPNGTVAAVAATAASTQATAVQLAAGINRVTGSDGVRLPNCNAGSSVIVVNDTGSSLKVWPPVGGAIQIPGTSFGLSVVNTPGTLTLFSTTEYFCVVGGAASLWAITKSA
jgi:hypothetical protein